MTTADHQKFEAGDIRLHSGEILTNAHLAYVTHGELNSSKDNAIVFTTRVGGTHADNNYLIGPGHALDPDHWFIVVPNQLGNGLSSSPSNTPAPQDRARFPMINHHDNADLQHRLMTEVFGVKRLALAAQSVELRGKIRLARSEAGVVDVGREDAAERHEAA